MKALTILMGLVWFFLGFFPKKILICHVYNSRYPQQKKTIKTTDIYIIAGVVIFQAQSKSVWKG